MDAILAIFMVAWFDKVQKLLFFIFAHSLVRQFNVKKETCFTNCHSKDIHKFFTFLNVTNFRHKIENTFFVSAKK